MRPREERERIEMRCSKTLSSGFRTGSGAHLYGSEVRHSHTPRGGARGPTPVSDFRAASFRRFFFYLLLLLYYYHYYCCHSYKLLGAAFVRVGFYGREAVPVDVYVNTSLVVYFRYFLFPFDLQ